MKLSKNKYHIILVILILLQVTNIIFWGSEKEGYHIDEIFSYGLSNGYYDPFPYYDNKDTHFMNWHNVEYFKDYVMVSEEHRFAYDSVYYNQSQDVHPPLYYMLLHTICSFFPETFSNWYALSINIVFSVLNIILLNNIASFVFKNKKEWALLVCGFYGFSAGCVSNAVYLRMYVMLTFFVMLFSFLHVKLYETEKYKVYFSLIALVTIGGSLTQYYFYIFAFFVSAFFCFYLLAEKKWKALCTYVVAMFGGIGISILFYPSAISHIFQGYRGTEAVDNLVSNNLAEKMSTYLTYVNLELLGGYLKYLVLMCVIAFFGLLFKNCIVIKAIKGKGIAVEYHLQGDFRIEKVEYANIGFFVATIFYAFLVAKMSTISANRYIFPVYPFIVLYLIWFFSFLVKKIVSDRKFLLVVVSVLLALLLVSQYRHGYIDYLYQGYAATQQEVAKYSENDVLYVGDYEFPIYRDMMFLAKAKRFIPIPVSGLEESLQEIKDDITSQSVVIYVYKEHNDNEVLNLISEELGYTQFDAIAETYQSRVYYGYK